MFFYIVLFLTALGVACNVGSRKSNLRKAEDFPVIIDLHGTTVFTENSNYNPLMMGLKDDILVVCDIENSPYFHVYKVPEFQPIGNFGTLGRGPFEFQNPVFWGQFDNSDGIQIWVYEMSSLKLSLVDVFEALQNPDYVQEKQWVAPSEFYESNNIMVFDNQVMLGSGVMEQGEFVIHNGSDSQVSWIEFNSNYTGQLKSFLNLNPEYIDILKQGVTKIKPDQSRFVKAHIYLPVIDVYNPDGTIDFSVQIKEDANLPEFIDGEFDPNTKGWYENIFLTDNYIYALNRNCILQDYFENECNNAEIHVYDWAGNAKAVYRHNEGIAQGAPFVVDETNFKIYTVNARNTDRLFSFFDLDGKLF